MMPPMHGANTINDRYRVPPPKHVREVPGYLRELVTTFLTRLLYIFKLVWETRKSLLFVMLLMCIFNGVMPVVGSVISAAILNDLAAVYAGEALAFRVVAVLLIYQFAYMFFTSAVSRVYTMFTSISGEMVSNHVKQQIMEKAKFIDMMS